jgi:hypothetical protein
MFDGSHPTRTEESDSEDPYDQALDRALNSSLRITRRIHREQARTAEALALLTKVGAKVFLCNVPRRFSGLAGFEALLARSRAVRDENGDRAESMRLAGAAVLWACRLSGQHYGRRQVRDFQCRAWLELAAAAERRGEVSVARQALAEAARSFLDGTGDEALAARLRSHRPPCPATLP